MLFFVRSHYVSSSSATQWKLLDEWASNHPGLWQVLTSPDLILFGEWLYAQHSIPYTKLSVRIGQNQSLFSRPTSTDPFVAIFRPDYFLAFDIFDKKAGKFFSRAERDKRLEGSGIRTVPLIAQGNFTTEQLKKMLDTKSQFHDGFVEGLYVRVDDGEYLKDRAKVVRPDFLQEIDTHWSKKTLVKNLLAFDEY